ncbi:MAG: NAD(P)-dependent oxidoreductase [Vicinamibacterales bacterium]|nr:NAD(P)-dependent oxidoreductase [Vicinamibacterales bacterium]
MTVPAPRSVLVLGHSGYIGSRVAAALAARGHSVIGRSIPPLDLTRDESVEALTDLLDPEGAVVVCAAIKKQLGDTPEIFARNLAMTINVGRALAARPVKRVVYFSSAAVYGEDVPHPVISEATTPEPTSFYGIGKFASERLILKMAGQHPGTSVAIVRPALVYGPHEPAYYYGPSGFLRKTLAGEPITLWGDGEERREFIYLDDVVALTTRLLESDVTGVLNVVSGTSYTFADALAAIEAITGQRPVVSSRPRSKDKVDHQFDNTRVRQAFPDFEFTGLERGLRRTLQAEGETRA